MKKYKTVNDTSYDERTSDEVVRILEQCRTNKTRIIVEYGDTETGQGWGDVCDVTGYVGRSGGGIKVPLLLYNSRSIGAPSILDHCIVSIQETRGKRFLYKHKNYTTGRQ